MRLIPLIILAALSLFGLGLSAGKHGQDHPNYNFGISLLAHLVEWGLILWMIL